MRFDLNKVVDVGDGSKWRKPRSVSRNDYRERLWTVINSSNRDHWISELKSMKGKRPVWRDGSCMSHLRILRAAVVWACKQ